MSLFIIYIVIVLLQLWFIRNTTINWYNKTIKYKNWEYTYTYSGLILAYGICIVPLFVLLLQPIKYWTLKYIKPIKRY